MTLCSVGVFRISRPDRFDDLPAGVDEVGVPVVRHTAPPHVFCVVAEPGEGGDGFTFETAPTY